MLWGDYNDIRYTMLSVNNYTHWYKNIPGSPLFGLYMGEPGNEATSTMKDVKTHHQDMQRSLSSPSQWAASSCMVERLLPPLQTGLFCLSTQATSPSVNPLLTPVMPQTWILGATVWWYVYTIWLYLNGTYWKLQLEHTKWKGLGYDRRVACSSGI